MPRDGEEKDGRKLLKEYNTSGTLGDAYIILCKLYNIAQKEPIICKHYTKYKNWYPAIKNIYSLCPNIKMQEEKRLIKNRMQGHFANKESYRIDKPTPFPKLNLPHITKFNLPDHYSVICIKSGKDIEKNRRIPETELKKIMTKEKNMVLIGTDISIELPGVINLIGSTSLLEAMAIVSNAHFFYGYQGLFCFVALSQKVHTVVYVKTEQHKKSVTVRMLPEWEKYLWEISRIKSQ